jgi:hypothetical protein
MPYAIYTSAAFTNGSGLAVAAGAEVEVREELTGDLATIYEDRDGSEQLTNPFNADSNGRFQFFAEGVVAGYRVKVTKGNQEYTLRYQPIGLLQYSDTGGGGGGGVPAGPITTSGLTMNTARILGRTTASTGAIEELDASSVMTNFVSAASESDAGKIEIATQAEIEAGTSNVLAVTPGRLSGAIGFTDYYVSADQTITNAGSLTLAHGLGRKPVLIQMWLKCTTANLNYSVNDEIPWWGNSDGDGSLGGADPSIVCDATNLNVRYGATNQLVTNKTSGVREAITTASWRAIFKAWA